MTFSDLVRAALHNEVFSGAFGASLVVSLIYGLKQVPGIAVDFVTWRFTSELMVFNEDPAFDVVSDWLASLEYTKKTRRLRLTSNYSHEQQGDAVQFSPGIGRHLIWFEGRPVIVSRILPEKGPGGSYKRREDISVRTFGASPVLMHDLLAQIVDARRKVASTKIEIFIYSGYWRLICRKNKRTLDSVVMPPAQQRRIVNDLEKFLVSRDWYEKLGIPYRRGLMLQGPPGCGKTSLVLALASHFQKRVYALNLGSMRGDDVLIEAITGVPENAILLIEDIDAAQVKRQSAAPARIAKPGEPESKEEIPVGVSLSALLNAIDGVFSRDGRILVMTTNFPDKIDPALLRGGRADLIENVGELGPREILTMCQQFELPEMAANFQDSIPPAQLQRVLLSHRASQ